MAQNSKGAEVQAMPIESTTFIGVATNTKIGGGTIQCVDAGVITFLFPTGNITVDGTAGSNFQAGSGCTGITTTGNIILT